MPRRIAFALIEHGRATEWLTSLVLLGFAMTLALPGDTFTMSPSYQGFRNLGFDEAAISTPLSLLASMRLVALYVNGSWQRTPMLRAVGAVVGATVFTMLTITFAWNWITHSNIALSTGPATYGTLALFDFLAAYRSGADVRASRSH
ncbi:hypothetical protein [Pseudooceanicola algae]|uniref:Uncharacterized protein n=1 Tax=Pseudooceanicola algae TaxID=1537215 RepID=A0A418SGN5_9RHOB|nr:hypothetical protein [Pseudooceanicola algae]QPM89392.1 hypothetical protein PSAL_006080 [Pseudooceanicola algae]